MMKIYEPNQERKGKQWSLTVHQDGDRANIWAVCDQTGWNIACIAFINNEGIFICRSAKILLEDGGYDTSLTQWDGNGAIKVAS